MGKYKNLYNLNKQKEEIMKNYKHKWIENLIIEDEYHLLREKKEQGYISYQFERLTLFFKHLINGKPQTPTYRK